MAQGQPFNIQIDEFTSPVAKISVDAILDAYGLLSAQYEVRAVWHIPSTYDYIDAERIRAWRWWVNRRRNKVQKGVNRLSRHDRRRLLYG